MPDPVPLYAVGFGGTRDEIARKSKTLLDEGFAAVKVRVGFDPDDDERLVETVSNAIGGGLLADANMGWDRDAAANMTTRLNAYGLGWLEEPLSRDDNDGLRELRSLASMPLAAGENCYSEEELVGLAKSETVDVLMPDLARVGGLTAAIAGARAALERGQAYSTHHYASDIGFSAMLALCTVVGKPAPILRDVSSWPIREEILTDPVVINAGTAEPYDGPGLSAVPRDDVMQEYRVL
ncbi:mandelate racemase/muconate lactonizing enzyme family protein [Paramicrobacterium fandaimingii]|uniref:mandelate racemase/muconate lactonizing enzyme family protein n=1 Tax=Paramicrobacterium fandaimingii TaxID=2708079 RepID=UPI001F2F2178|nr:enolase C-terminal domain-like protein [Microbacterium fandaimingii]